MWVWSELLVLVVLLYVAGAGEEMSAFNGTVKRVLLMLFLWGVGFSCGNVNSSHVWLVMGGVDLVVLVGGHLVVVAAPSHRVYVSGVHVALAPGHPSSF